MKYNKHSRILVCVLAVTTATGICLWLVARGNQNTAKNNLCQPVPYEILNDYMGTTISIGVKADINAKQLQATLVEAANEHQDDTARDYLTSMYLWVEAYLIKDGQRSKIPAGRLRRYVPLGTPAERRRMLDREKWDSFTIMLDEAQQSLK